MISYCHNNVVCLSVCDDRTVEISVSGIPVAMGSVVM